ncbi:hypothetical protein GGX14DRAFT_618589 [Mycena pura]|uniref:Uncharacterized protein n=1 Tax=Mycena pura TaxID=153505 RepID=A0AAD6YDF5_9AGAR|nr:hypothetical protein GGX14DRAFT_618589 [Mycena pura]
MIGSGSQRQCKAVQQQFDLLQRQFAALTTAKRHFPHARVNPAFSQFGCASNGGVENPSDVVFLQGGLTVLTAAEGVAGPENFEDLAMKDLRYTSSFSDIPILVRFFKRASIFVAGLGYTKMIPKEMGRPPGRQYWKKDPDIAETERPTLIAELSESAGAETGIRYDRQSVDYLMCRLGECVTFLPQNHHHRDQCRPAVECPKRRQWATSHPRHHIEPSTPRAHRALTPTSLLHTRAHPELHAYSCHSHLFISFLVHLWTPPTHPRAQSDDYEPVARTFFSGAHREGKGIPCGLSSSLPASPAPMPVLYDALAPSSVQHTQEPLFVDHIPFGASQAIPWFWIPSPPSSPLPETHARSPTPLSHPPLAPSRISVAAPSAPIAPESSRKPRSRRCFICGKTKTHPLDFRVCPRTRELIEQKLVKYNGKWRLVLFDGSPLPMTRSRGGVASHLLSCNRIPIHVHSDAPPAQRAPRLASPKLNPSSSHRNLPHRVLLPHMPTAYVPTAVTEPSPAFPSPHIHPPHSSATPPSRSPVSFANKFTLPLFDFLVAARKHRNDLIHVRLILFFKHGISRARSIVPPTVEVPYERHNHHHRDQCRPAVECPSERASSLPSRNVASGLLAIRATTSSHPRPEHIEPLTPTSLLHTRAHPELHAYSCHSHLFISFLVHLWTPPTHPRAQSDDYEPVARTFFNGPVN